MTWYLVHTKPREELRALENLERQGYRCFLPMLAVEKLRRGAVTRIEEPLFPRYLFIELDADGSGPSWAPIRSTKGVSQLVRFGLEAARIDDRLISALRTREDSPRQLFHEGERVTIVAGPFAGIEAVFDIADGERRAMVLVEMLGKRARLGVQLGQIAPAEAEVRQNGPRSR